MNHSMDDYTVRTSNYILHFSGLFCAMYRANRWVKSNVSQKDIKLPVAPARFALKSAILIGNFLPLRFLFETRYTV